MMSTFSYGHLFLISIFYRLTSDKNHVHTGNLTHCRQTLQLIKFYLMKNMKDNRGNRLSQSKFPFISILWCFFYHMVKFAVSLISLSSVDLFVCFPYNLNYCCQQMRGSYKMCTVIDTLIPESDQHQISLFNIIPESNIKVMRIKEMIISRKTSWLLNKFSLPAHYQMYGEQYGESEYRWKGVEGLKTSCNQFYRCRVFLELKIVVIATA